MIKAAWFLPRWALKLWWRLREHDSGIPKDVTGSPPQYPFGKVSGLQPELTVISETGETPYVCCGYCAAHMACWTAREGLSQSMFNEAHDIRAYAGRPHDNGSNATELRNGAAETLDITLEAIAVSEIKDRLHAGFAVAISLQYGSLPDYLKVQGGDFGHGVCFYGYRELDDCIGYFDPLWPNGASGAWAKWGDVKRALWGDGNHSTTITKWKVAAKGEDVMFNVAPMTTHRDALVKAGAVLYEDSGLSLRYSAIGDTDKAFGFVGSTNVAHIIINAGNTNYVERDDVLDIYPNDRTFD